MKVANFSECVDHKATMLDTSHPTDPLTSVEIRQAADLCRKHFDTVSIRYNTISLAEPCLDSPPSSRLASVILLFPEEAVAHNVLVDLTASRVLTVQSLNNGQQPPFSPDDCLLAEAIVKGDTEIIKLVRDRFGIVDVENQLVCDPWSVHLSEGEEYEPLSWRDDKEAARLVQTFLYRRDCDGDNHYAHPIDLLPIVDLNARKVVAIEGRNRGKVDIPAAKANYAADLLSENVWLERKQRGEDLKRLEVKQIDGPSFKVAGRDVEWQKWRLRVCFSPREGVILRDVTYNGRMVLQRASLAEMAVPYAEPRAPYQRKCAFDVGDYGLGFCAVSLQAGCDCLGEIFYFDEVLNDSEGNPYTVEKTVCMHEEDAGLLYKHVEYRNGHSESRRARRLVISFVATVVNYEYLFYWYLHMDGSVGLEIKLSGELSTNTLSEGETIPEHGTLVAPGVNAQIHQHMFCARLDPAIDGPSNSVSEIEFVPAEIGKDNPYGNSFTVKSTPLKNEKQARREAQLGRTWRVSNPSKLNEISGKAVGYKLVPFAFGSAQPLLLTAPECAVTKRGGFATKALWVTPYCKEERFPAGDYPVQSIEPDGLPVWTEKDRNIENRRIVVWHSFGVAHLPRTEDFPVMPCESAGFLLKPDCFFVGNPGIDLPPDSAEANGSRCCSTANCS